MMEGAWFGSVILKPEAQSSLHADATKAWYQAQMELKYVMLICEADATYI